ncbi:MAG: flagellar biosynthesis protein FlhA [Candidatus Eisenbacteria bacterium]|uniref:Flagellar biosynthesis protein FlhA n=1 Tax=Eiseniibacteriota bacterium TaxID=2212470 RepID=A0A956N8Y9_UNCEI|nr:flagellar biosynthesis protein FlhA [Candidatus Eisenbacteria bacterium]
MRGRITDVLMGGAILLLLAVLIVPVPTFLLDSLLILNLATSLIMLLVTVYVAEPLKFSVFPTLLLIVTLYRLSLNVATTRTILLEGYGGKVIAAFGDFVVGGNYAVGLVAFLILVVVQFLVITKGAGRIAEVAARFTLDAMPGRQMAIDADLNAGLIDEVEAKRRREHIANQADFYGAMDGAAKYVRGDAIAGIVITIINIIGGFVIGMAQQGMSVSDALRTYTLLTIGDGLVAQIPALIVSTASGLLITRSDSQKNLSRDIATQLFTEPRAALLAGAILALLGFVPGLPLVPFLMLSALCTGLGLRSSKEQKKEAIRVEQETKAKTTQAPEKVEQLLSVDTLELEIGFGLIPLVDEERDGGDLLRRVTSVRRQAAIELGLLVPPVRVRDNIRLPQDGYVVRLKGVEIGRGNLRMGQLLAMSPGPGAIPLEGQKTIEPVFGLDAVWIRPEQRTEADAAGYTVVEPTAVVATHLSELVKANASEILGRQEVQTMIDQVKQTTPVVVDELIPAHMTVGGVHKVLQRLLTERISIRDMLTILETLADHAPMTKDIDTLAERVREALGRAITQPLRDDRGEIGVVSLDPSLEQALVEHVQGTGMDRLLLGPEETRRLLDRISQAVQEALARTAQPVLLCSPYLRPYLRRFVERALPHVPVLSYSEVSSAGTVRTLATVKAEHAHQAV